MQTIGDVIDAINRSTSGVHAAINSTGDGIVLTDTANGSGTLSVTEGNSTTAHDLGLPGHGDNGRRHADHQWLDHPHDHVEIDRHA